MKTSRKCITVAAVLILLGVMLGGYGCKKTDSAAEAGESVALCIKCGQIKGDVLCCKPDQAKCDECGLAQGSIGCCEIPEGATEVAICTKCGYFKGTEACCKPNQPKCDECGLAKGSLACCKLPR